MPARITKIERKFRDLSARKNIPFVTLAGYFARSGMPEPMARTMYRRHLEELGINGKALDELLEKRIQDEYGFANLRKKLLK